MDDLPAVSLRPATSADVGPMVALVDEVVAWLVERGRAGQWGAEPVSADPEFVARTAALVAAGLVTVAVRSGVVVGALAAGPGRPDYVPAGLLPDDALYVHTVATARTAAGTGVGGLLLAEAGRRADTAGTAVALDHWADSPELAQLYERAGYHAVADVVLDQRGAPWRGTVRLRPATPRTDQP